MPTLLNMYIIFGKCLDRDGCKVCFVSLMKVIARYLRHSDITIYQENVIGKAYAKSIVWVWENPIQRAIHRCLRRIRRCLGNFITFLDTIYKGYSEKFRYFIQTRVFMLNISLNSLIHGAIISELFPHPSESPSVNIYVLSYALNRIPMMRTQRREDWKKGAGRKRCMIGLCVRRYWSKWPLSRWWWELWCWFYNSS